MFLLLSLSLSLNYRFVEYYMTNKTAPLSGESSNIMEKRKEKWENDKWNWKILDTGVETFHQPSVASQINF